MNHLDAPCPTCDQPIGEHTLRAWHDANALERA